MSAQFAEVARVMCPSCGHLMRLTLDDARCDSCGHRIPLTTDTPLVDEPPC